MKNYHFKIFSPSSSTSLTVCLVALAVTAAAPSAHAAGIFWNNTGTAANTNHTGSMDRWSLASIGPDVSGDALKFDNQLTQSWTSLTTTGGITGSDAADYSIHVGANNGTGEFSNALASGTSSLGQDASNPVLSHTAVPEPYYAELVGGIGMLALLRRRR